MTITFQSIHTVVETSSRQTILEAAQVAGLNIPATCSGHGRCRSCRIRIIQGRVTPPTRREREALGNKAIREGVRLSCQTRPLEDIIVRHDPANTEAQHRILHQGEPRARAVPSAQPTEAVYKIACDLGTTTVVGYLMDAQAAETLAVAADLNGQTVYGGDVMSRISFVQRHHSGLAMLHARVVQTLNGIIQQLSEQAGIAPHQITEMTVVGNPCMHHLFLQLDPTPLGQAPYLPAITKRYTTLAEKLGIAIAPHGRVVMLPLIAGFVGADTVGMILATGLHTRSKLTLAVDIGTNGEIVLGSQERLIACSTAAGPAFEGARITQGMRGAAGAIEHVRIVEDVECQVIGNVPACGICGSGVVAAIAQLLQAGLITPAGRLLSQAEVPATCPPKLTARLVEAYGSRTFILMDGQQTCQGNPISLTQQDIREVQLAKGAVAAGIKLLLQELGKREEEVFELLLAGAFGNYLDIESAVRIGLIPDFSRQMIRSVGNAAGSGAQQALLSEDARLEADHIADITEHISLADRVEFQDTFVEAMGFPMFK